MKWNALKVHFKEKNNICFSSETRSENKGGAASFSSPGLSIVSDVHYV